MKSINTLITNLIKRDLARVKKKLLHHTAASIKLYILTYSLCASAIL